MAPEIIGLLGILGLLVLLALRVPVALAMMIVAVLGFGATVSPSSALARFGQDAFRDGSAYALSVVPMFVLMGMFLANAGLGADLYRALGRFLWKVRGGLGIATIGASALFGAVNGSSVAAATTMSLVAVPPMRKAGYNPGFAGAVTAAGSTLGSLIPPSALLVLFGILTEFSIGDVLLAALIPGLLVTVLLLVTAYLIAVFRPSLTGVTGKVAPPSDLTKVRALGLLWPIPLIFGVSMGGLYGGIFTPTEAGAAGAFLALVYGVVTRRLSLKSFFSAVGRTIRISAMVFLLIIAGKMFGYFLTASRIPQGASDWVSGLAVAPVVIIFGMFVLYFILGALMDEASILVILTPITLPIALSLGYDGVWFGVISIMMLLTGLITPPVGIVDFVVSGVAKVELSSIFRHIAPFVIAVVIGVILVIIFPELALFLVS